MEVMNRNLHKREINLQRVCLIIGMFFLCFDMFVISILGHASGYKPYISHYMGLSVIHNRGTYFRDVFERQNKLNTTLPKLDAGKAVAGGAGNAPPLSGASPPCNTSSPGACFFKPTSKTFFWSMMISCVCLIVDFLLIIAVLTEVPSVLVLWSTLTAGRCTLYLVLAVDMAMSCSTFSNQCSNLYYFAGCWAGFALLSLYYIVPVYHLSVIITRKNKKTQATSKDISSWNLLDNPCKGTGKPKIVISSIDQDIDNRQREEVIT